MRDKLLLYFIFLLILILSNGCANVIVKSDSDPNVSLTDLKSFYVQKFEPDKRGLERIIAEKLNDLGYNATSGVDKNSQESVDVLVTYKDRWMWDITNYMLEINIEFHDPKTNFTFASGRSYRTSLARKSPEFMIDEVLHDLFKYERKGVAHN